jgi:hypothetical protein
MRLALCLLLLSFAYNASAQTAPLQQGPNNHCPTINISCPDLVSSGQPITFTADISGISPAAKLSYKWTVSPGTITEGQGSNSIKVDTDGLSGVVVTANLEVEGFDSRCSSANKATNSTTVMVSHPPRLFDQYGDIAFNDEKARLDNFAIQLQKDPGAQGYIIAYGGRVTFVDEAIERAERARNYLTSNYNVVNERIVMLDGGYREDLTIELFIIPTGRTPPTASPTLRPEDVQVVEKPKPRERRRNR